MPEPTSANLAYLERSLPRYRCGVRIDQDSPEHPYVQLAGILRERIRAGEIGPRVPSITKLAEEAEVSPATVKRALKILRDEGVIVTVRGRGTFVAS